MCVVFIGFISLLAVFLFHFSEVSSYQKQADSILQHSTYIPSVSDQENVNYANSTTHLNPKKRLAKLDKHYEYQFVIQPVHRKYSNDDNSQQTYDNGQHIHADLSRGTNDLSTPNHYNNGQRMYYVIKIHIPYEDVTEKLDGHNGSYEVNPRDSSHYNTNLISGFDSQEFAKTVCQTNNDTNNKNTQQH